MPEYQIHMKRRVVEYSTTIVVEAANRTAAIEAAKLEAVDGCDWCDAVTYPPTVHDIERIDATR